MTVSHSTGARHSTRTPVEPIDPRNPGDAFLQQEIDSNRRAERWLVLKAAIAIAIVAALVVVREVVFL
jgi:hypothetical protein